MPTIDNLIEVYEKDVEWYKNEMRMGDEMDRAVYSEARTICQRIVQDLKDLKRDQDAHSPQTP